jgi:hypothetical protein
MSFISYLTPLTVYNEVGANFCFIFKSWEQNYKVK